MNRENGRKCRNRRKFLHFKTFDWKIATGFWRKSTRACQSDSGENKGDMTNLRVTGCEEKFKGLIGERSEIAFQI